MADGSGDARGKRLAAEAMEDRLSGLPDDLLQHILSFLPSRDAVRTCVLARHYREQWKSVRAIRITGDNIRTFWGPTALNTFVTCLLLFRNKLLLDEAELNTYEGDEHSPILENLILQFHPNHYNLVEMGASYNLKKHSLILKNLTLEVKCAQVDDRIIRILELFHSCGLPLEKIKIKHLPTLSDNQFPETWASSGSFSSEQKT
ncbi:hypothetical protein PR202_gb19767 [Eleusine coracana subsp. coracana]|uniref:F-box domain-containing protein n=1 Tax=Eleusine coracana subsp. coracana TaxID=191504 RepID=A0AAV5F929_ELECO|nr:hypothetical protein QOZ80_3BG0281090 [Eleusine coracana subsp. coracana]GJN31376.1 hypothetical protein PR202_gb19767 [Eleusine coracana subsp. coracana]